MKWARIMGALFAGALTVPAVAQEEPIVWGAVGNWTIAVDTSVGMGCFAYISFTDGTFFRLGFSNLEGDDPFYVMLGNYDWASIESGKDYDLTLQFDDAQPWAVPAIGTRMGNVPTLMFSGGDLDFLDELRRKHWLAITFNGRLVTELSLSGSTMATNEMANCQLTVDEVVNAGGDPFAQPPSPAPSAPPSASNSGDPFSA